MEGTMGMGGKVAARVIRAERAPLIYKVRNLGHVLPGLAQDAIAKALGMNHMAGRLYARKRGADGRVVDYGLICTQKVTTAFCALMVDQLQTETSVWGDFKHHDSGVGTTAEDNADTAMETTDGESRVAGTQTEGSSVQYVSVGTIAYTTTKAITEHGLFNHATDPTLMDRSVFSAINVVNGDSVEFTFTLTCTAGG